MGSAFKGNIFSFLALFLKETSMFVPLLIAYQYFKNSGEEKDIKINKKLFIMLLIAEGIIMSWFIIKKFLGYRTTAGIIEMNEQTFRLMFLSVMRGF